jgi:hypothetical protein
MKQEIAWFLMKWWIRDLIFGLMSDEWSGSARGILVCLTLNMKALTVLQTFGTVYLLMWAGIAQPVLWLAMGWMVRGLNPGGDNICCTRPEWPWDPPSLQKNGYRLSPGVKRPGRGLEHPPPQSSAEVKERVELYIYSNLGLCGLF